ncbi:hypothetical protein [Butyrivibrio sp. AD3002]|uniref:hypothetical protein n=1 Tax=Butyrivibrio sp. AD3002 TaxID=1280670 RepID=UPI0003B3A58E|nr:hypothetical protein [Butyrivibrio sp. AD3002]
MKKKIRIIIDISMTVMMPLLMAYSLIDPKSGRTMSSGHRLCADRSGTERRDIDGWTDPGYFVKTKDSV